MKLSTINMIDPTQIEPLDNVTLIGMAHDGPVLTPFSLREGVDPISLLGKNQLAANYIALEESGMNREDIIIYRLNGVHGRAELISDRTSFLEFKTIGASDEDKSVSIESGFQTLIIKKTFYDESDIQDDNSKEIESIETQVYTLSDYTYLEDLVIDINHDAELGIIDVAANPLVEGKIKELFTEKQELFFSNSSSEDAYCLRADLDLSAHHDNYMEKLDVGLYEEGTFERASFMINTEMMYFTDAYFDKDERLAYIAGMFANEKKELTGQQVFSILSCSPIPGRVEPPDWYVHISDNRWMSENGEVSINPNEKIQSYLSSLQIASFSARTDPSISENIQVIVGDTFVADQVISLASYYIGTYFETPYYLPVSNKNMRNSQFGEEISKSSIDILQHSGYICCVQSIRRNCVPVGAQSFSNKNDNSLKHLHNKRLVSRISKDLKDFLSPLIGNNALRNFQQSSIETQLTAFFNEYVKDGIIREFNLSVSEIELINDYTGFSIDLNLSLFSELKKIKAGITLDSQRGVSTQWTAQD